MTAAAHLINTEGLVVRCELCDGKPWLYVLSPYHFLVSDFENDAERPALFRRLLILQVRLERRVRDDFVEIFEDDGCREAMDWLREEAADFATEHGVSVLIDDRIAS